ncbi:MAG: cation transporter, partial [Vitreoscilla sp.]|nr:cation transporter [Polaromonas sp.]
MFFCFSFFFYFFLIFSLYANRLSRRKASLDQTFGYKRAELIAAFVNAITLIVVAFILIYEAVLRFFHPEPIQSTIVIWLALLGIVVNGSSVLLLKKDSEHNLNMKSAYLHLLTDMMASVAVLAGGIIMHFYGWFWVDSVMTLLIAFYLIYVSYDLIKT